MKTLWKKIKEQIEKIVKKIPENKLYEALFMSRKGKLLLAAVCVFFAGVLTYNYIVRPPITHIELYRTYSFYKTAPGESFLNGIFTKTFDMRVDEYGAYRPRILCYMLMYLDSNMLMVINKFFPWWGSRLPLNILSVTLLVFGLFLLLRKLFPDIPAVAALAAAMSVLFFANSQTGIYINLRSSKYLTGAVYVFVLLSYLELKDLKMKLKYILPTVLGSVFLCFLMTLDEMMITVVLLFIAMFFAGIFLTKRINAGAVIYAFSDLRGTHKKLVMVSLVVVMGLIGIVNTCGIDEYYHVMLKPNGHMPFYHAPLENNIKGEKY